MGPYQRGFDRDKILKNKIIHNINPNSNAYKAGLRNGDKVIEFSFPKGSDPDQIAKTKPRAYGSFWTFSFFQKLFFILLLG